MQAIIDAIAACTLDAEIVRVVANRKAAYGLTRAGQAGIPTLYVPLKPYVDAGRPRTEYDADLAALIAPDRPDIVVQAGWLHIFSPAFLDCFQERVINLHPALPGVMAGKDSLRGTFDARLRGADIPTGCMVHRVSAELDAGEVLGTRSVPVLPGDTLESFAGRMHAAEHALLLDVLRQLAAGLSQPRRDVDVASLVIRPFESRDQERTRALVRAGLADHFGAIDPSLNEDLNTLSRWPGVFLVGELAGDIVASGAYCVYDGAAKIERMSVRRDLRGRRVGARMLDAVIAAARADGFSRIVLETTSTWSDVITFYARNGFRVTHQVDQKWGGETWMERAV